jgi:hypothetical protein
MILPAKSAIVFNTPEQAQQAARELHDVRRCFAISGRALIFTCSVKASILDRVVIPPSPGKPELDNILPITSGRRPAQRVIRNTITALAALLLLGGCTSLDRYERSYSFTIGDGKQTVAFQAQLKPRESQ